MPEVRFLHASPGVSNVDIYVNGSRYASNVPYNQHTGYLRFPGGAHQIIIYPAGRRLRPIFSGSVTLNPEGFYTIAASGYPGRVVLLPISEQPPMAVSGQAYVKFAHLSPNTPNVDIVLPDGTVLFSNIGYNGRTSYVAVTPGTYTLYVNLAGTNQTVLTVPNVVLAPGVAYTVYATGVQGSSSNPLRVVITQDGS
ncbi:MAG: DUF4397 domain-containing protein [Thermacetogeniaceae bacterium]